jgi:acrosin
MLSRLWTPVALRSAPRRPIRRLHLESLELRDTPASLNIVGGALTFTGAVGETNALSLSVTGGVYKFTDAGATITLGAGALAAGWTGSGTGSVTGRDSSVSSIAVNLGDMDDTFDLLSTNDAVTVRGDAGNDTIRLGSNGAALTGHLNGINAPVTVTANGGTDNLVVVDYAATTANTVVIGSSTITGIAGPSNNRTISYGTSNGGTFSQVEVIGSNSPSVNESFTLNNPGAPLLLLTNDGPDVVNVQALSAAATINTGAGNDAITVSSSATRTAGKLDGINANVTIDAGAGVNSLTVNDYASTIANTNVQISATQITGMAGTDNSATIAYAATAGSFSSLRIEGSNTAADAFTIGAMAGANSAAVFGNGGADSFTVSADTRATLDGGAGADTFTLAADGATLTGSISGGAGADTLSYAGRSGGTAVSLTGVVSGSGFSGTATGVTGGFTGIDSLAGGSGADALTGMNAVSSWAVGSTSTYTSGAASLALSSVEVLNGGSMADTFNVSGNATADLYGNGGNDSFTFTADGATLTGLVDGGSGANSLSYAGYTSPVAVALANSDVNGFSGTGTGISGGFAAIRTIAGGSGSDSLTGEDVDSVWSLGSARSYSDGAANLAFSGFESLQGGSGSDTFKVLANMTANILGGGGDDSFQLPTNGVVLSGSIDGQDGTDSLSYAGRSSAVAVKLTDNSIDGFSGTATGTSGFAGIDNLAGGAGSDSLTGEDVDASWVLDTSKSYSNGSQDLTFASFETLTGGSGADSFAVTANSAANLNGGGGDDVFNLGTDGVSLTGSIAGGSGSNTLSYAGRSGAVNVTLGASLAGTASGVSGGYSGISTLVGSGGGTLTGESVASTWTVDANSTYDDGSNVVSFTGFGTLQGGGGADTFNVQTLASGASLTLAGGNGNDAFILSPTDANLDAVEGNLSVVGGAGSDTLTMNDQNNDGIAFWGLSSSSVTRGGLVVDYAGLEQMNVNAGSGGNSFDLGAVVSGLAVNLDAGSGTNYVNLGQYSNVWGVAGTLAVKGTGSNVVTVDATADTGNVAWVLTDAGITRNGTAGVTFGSAPAEVVVRAGSGNDSFDVTAAAGTAFSVDGGYTGPQNDTLTVHTGGAGVGDDGSVVSVVGMQDVSYTGLSVDPTTMV